MIAEARKEGKSVHVASLMAICHLKNSVLEPKFQKYRGRVVLRGDIVKDDSGLFAVFTEQGSSASQNDGRKCDGYHCKATRMRRTSSGRNISLHTQVKMEDAPSLMYIPKSDGPDIVDSSTTTQMAQIMVQHGRPSRSS